MTSLSAIMLVLLSSRQAMLLMKVLTFVFFLPGTVLLSFSQLYHNNYAVRANGVREFTQGFHIQSLMCADTDIRYVLNIIKKYEYKPEEYALHNGKLNKAEKKKAKQCQVEKIQKLTLSLEALLGEKTAEPTLWQKVKSHIPICQNNCSFLSFHM